MSEKPQLLIVDDHEEMLETLSDVLQEKGYRVETARTGEEAIEKARTHFFNVALIDIKLPDMLGLDVLRTFREKYPSRMNIMITGYATLQNSVEALNLGANAYIMKPIDFSRLESIIAECLKKQQEALKITQEKVAEFAEEVMLAKEGKWEKSDKPTALV